MRLPSGGACSPISGAGMVEIEQLHSLVLQALVAAQAAAEVRKKSQSGTLLKMDGFVCSIRPEMRAFAHRYKRSSRTV